MIADFDVTMALIIHTTESLSRITEIMGIAPTTSIKGCDANTDDLSMSGESIWIYHTKYKRKTDLDQCMQQFVAQFSDFSSRVTEAKKNGICAIRISIVSLYAQFGFSLSNQELQLLSELNIPLEMTVFSFGNCIDDTVPDEQGSLDSVNAPQGDSGSI